MRGHWGLGFRSLGLRHGDSLDGQGTSGSQFAMRVNYAAAVQHNQGLGFSSSTAPLSY